MKLYYVPRTRAGRVRWALEEIGAPYDLHRLDVGALEHRQPPYLAIHPHGRVPALVDGTVQVFESAAICMYLADKYPESRLAPPLGTPERAHYYQWILYAMATLEPIAVEIFALPEATRAATAKARFADCTPVLERALDGHEFIVGDHLTVADIVLGGVVTWARMMGGFDSPLIVAYTKRLGDRPASRRARAD